MRNGDESTHKESNRCNDVNSMLCSTAWVCMCMCVHMHFLDIFIASVFFYGINKALRGSTN